MSQKVNSQLVTSELCVSLLRVMQQAGGMLKVADATLAVFKDLNLSDEYKPKGSEGALYDRLSWVKRAFKLEGFIDEPTRSFWQLTEAGRKHVWTIRQ